MISVRYEGKRVPTAESCKAKVPVARTRTTHLIREHCHLSRFALRFQIEINRRSYSEQLVLTAFLHCT